MTQCVGSPAQEVAEQYLAGGLPEADAERFENHYFGCEPCHEYLVHLKEIRDSLAREPIVIAVSNARPARTLSLGGRILAFPVQVAVLGSIAATLIIGTVLVSLQKSAHLYPPTYNSRHASSAPGKPQDARPTGEHRASTDGQVSAGNTRTSLAAQQSSDLAMLADLRLPGYQQTQLRGETGEDTSHAAYLAGMQAYAQGNCNHALEVLKKVAATAEDGVAAKLYSGLCQLKERNLSQAQASFTALVNAGDTPELETAEYFLAQTLLLQGDAKSTKNWLVRTIALHGDYEERAKKQLAALPH